MYDDHKVSYITESNVEKAEAYILFYQRRDGNATSLREPAPLPASVSPHLFGATRCKTSDRDLVNGNKDPLTLTHTEIQTQQDYTNDPFSSKQTYPECGCKRGESGPSTCGSVNAEEEIPQEDELDWNWMILTFPFLYNLRSFVIMFLRLIRNWKEVTLTVSFVDLI